MKRIALALTAVVLSAAAAQAGDRFAVAYGNTVTRTNPDGSKTVIYVNADKTWEQHMGSMVVKGTYEWKDDAHACFTQVSPAPQDAAHATDCSEIKDEHKVGDTWTETAPNGQSYTMAITAGR